MATRRRSEVQRPQETRNLRSILLAVLGATTFFAGMAYLTSTGTASRIVPLGYAAVSAVSCAAYGVDKLSARRQARRTPETTLHLLDLLGGWPGSLVAQQLFRRKRRKVSFMTVFAATAVLHVAYWAWVAYESGAAFPALG